MEKGNSIPDNTFDNPGCTPVNIIFNNVLLAYWKAFVVFNDLFCLS